MKLKLTQKTILRICQPPAEGETFASGKPRKQALYWDTEHPGFGLAVGLESRTFVLQKTLPGSGKVRRIVIGRHPSWTVDAARKRARELTVVIDSGVDPVVESRRKRDRGVTLAEAMEGHLTSLAARGGCISTAKDVRLRLKCYLRDWLPRPLAEITKLECRNRHRLISDESGPYVANCVFRYVRAIYNSSLKVHDLPSMNPCLGVTWNKMRRRQEPVSWTELPGWYTAATLMMPVRRDFHLLVLLTGLRSTDAATLRWEHVDLVLGTMHRPRPKGGEDRAFTVPVAREVVRILSRRREENRVLFPEGDGGWVFPCWAKLGGGVTFLANRRFQWQAGPGRSPHRLRDTFATAAVEAGVDWLALKILLNHSAPSGCITAGYVRPSVESLRPSVEKVAEFLMVKCGLDRPKVSAENCLVEAAAVVSRAVAASAL